MAAAEDNYVCQLDARTAEKAKKELTEDAKDRLNAVAALRTWIQQQPHIKIHTDTLGLLYFLRSAKYSQLRARTMVENYCQAVSTFPQWFRNIDTHDPDTVEAIESGYLTPLPKRDKNGCAIMLYKLGVTKEGGELMTVKQEMQAASVSFFRMQRDENVQVNGFVFIFDMSGVGTKQMARFSSSDMRKWNSFWQKPMPGRLKAFHYYNAGTIFEALMAIIRPILSKKLQNRIHVHDTAESLYKAIGMEALPDEYLPDDYTGPSSGPLKQIIQKYKNDVMAEDYRQEVLCRTSAEYFNYDESKKPAGEPVNESFRKLTVD